MITLGPARYMISFIHSLPCPSVSLEAVITILPGLCVCALIQMIAISTTARVQDR